MINNLLQYIKTIPYVALDWMDLAIAVVLLVYIILILFKIPWVIKINHSIGMVLSDKGTLIKQVFSANTLDWILIVGLIFITIYVVLWGYIHAFSPTPLSPQLAELAIKNKEVSDFILATKNKEVSDFILDTIKAVGFTIVASGIFATILKTSRFLDVISKSLADLIYSPQYLQRVCSQEKLKLIWRETSQALCQDRISSELMRDIEHHVLDKLFPYQETFIYGKVEKTTEIELMDDNFIEVIEFVKMQLVRQNDQEFTYTFGTSAKRKNDNDKTNIEWISIKVGDDPEPTTLYSKQRDQQNAQEIIIFPDPKAPEIMDSKIKIKLKGATSYQIQLELRKVFCLDVDNLLENASQRYIRYFNQVLRHNPRKLQLTVASLLNMNKEIPESRPHELHITCKEIIFPYSPISILIHKK